MTDVEEGNKGVTIAGCLKGRAYKTAMKLKIQRVREDVNNPGQLTLATLTGDDAIAEPASDAVVRPADGQVLLPAQPSGIRAMLERLRTQYALHDQDLSGVALDDFFDHSRGHASLIEHIEFMEDKYDDAEERAGLNMNNITKTHLMMKTSGLPEKLQDDLLLKVDGDRNRYEELKALILRITKKQQASKETGGTH